MNVVEAIRQKYPGMTKKQKALAEYMLAQPDSMSFMTLKALAAAAQVSEMTILHYCTALGFANYNELKYAFRQYQSERAKIAVHGDGQYNAADLPADLLTDKRSLLAQICQEEFDLMKQFFAELDLDALFQAADMALDCRVILVCARGVSLQIADFLVNRLTTLGLPSLTVNTEFRAPCLC
ncbi:MAG: MurR/RpiR family transcriptional regulator [Clostridiaceae bacterium]|jgi:DNA-binding MurR/RpiR family transcriptional regulator|nr:MurR/RpiR family transcriptional regulator [Clostridiaceae bacterium]